VTALEPCHLVQFTAEACMGLGVELTTLRCHIVSLMLQRVLFFATIDAMTRDEVAKLLQIEYLPAGATVFEESSEGSKFYIVFEGRVGIFESGEQIGHFYPSAPFPWFGEMALRTAWSQFETKAESRYGSAITLEPTKLLSLDKSLFPQFMALVPSFIDMFNTSTVSYNKLNKLNRRRRAEVDNNSAEVAADAAAVSKVDAIGAAPVRQHARRFSTSFEQDLHQIVPESVHREEADEPAAESPATKTTPLSSLRGSSAVGVAGGSFTKGGGGRFGANLGTSRPHSVSTDVPLSPDSSRACSVSGAPAMPIWPPKIPRKQLDMVYYARTGECVPRQYNSSMP